MLPTSAIAQVPEIIWFQVFKFGEIRDFMRWQRTCRRLREFTSHCTEIYERESLRIYMSCLDCYEYDATSKHCVIHTSLSQTEGSASRSLPYADSHPR